MSLLHMASFMTKAYPFYYHDLTQYVYIREVVLCKNANHKSRAEATRQVSYYLPFGPNQAVEAAVEPN